MLVHLAEDSTFRGIVVVDFPPYFVFNVKLDQSKAQDAIQAYRDLTASPARRWEDGLRRLLPAGLLLRHPRLKPNHLLGDLATARISTPPAFNMRDDRFAPFVFERNGVPTDQEYEAFRRGGVAASPHERDSIIETTAGAVARIQARGGAVVFVAMPTCGERRRIEDERYPPAQYWDAAIRRVPAPFLDEREPELASDRFPCADGSHLDRSATTEFTRSLARLVRARVTGKEGSPQ
jgi:hypothetical protein